MLERPAVEPGAQVATLLACLGAPSLISTAIRTATTIHTSVFINRNPHYIYPHDLLRLPSQPCLREERICTPNRMVGRDVFSEGE